MKIRGDTPMLTGGDDSKRWWGKCSSSFARWATNSVVLFQRSSDGIIPAMMWRLSGGVGRRQPLIVT